MGVQLSPFFSIGNTGSYCASAGANAVPTCALAVAAAVGLTAPAMAADAPPVAGEVIVTATRIGVGLPGASTTVIDGDEIRRSPVRTLPEILGLEAGVQNRDLFGGTAGSQGTIDLRGFGAVGKQNTLILVDGRRQNDIDLAAIDFANIPFDSIERIEITRGNAGAVLYGDGAVGGVINIVTKGAVGRPGGASGNVAAGSNSYREANLSGSHTAGAYSISGYGAYIETNGYRENNDLNQRNLTTELRRRDDGGEYFLKFGADDQSAGLPGARRVTLASNQLVTDRRGATTPDDRAQQNGISTTFGTTRKLTDDVELVLDMGVRRKEQEASIIDNSGGGFNQFIETDLTTLSVTPRVNAAFGLAGVMARSVLGIDYYHTNYNSERKRNPNETAVHRYNAYQQSIAVYLQNKVAITSDLDANVGGRVQRVSFAAGDTFDANAPGAFGVGAASLSDTDTQYAASFGLDYRVADWLEFFGRVGRSFRVPTVDERIATEDSTSFDLRTQTSRDAEVGARVTLGPVHLQTSAWYMKLRNEIRFDPEAGPFGFGANKNFDPTRRFGVETSAEADVTDDVRVKASVSYTEAEFTAGPFDGKDVPLVAPWTASWSLAWDISPYAAFNTIVRYVSEKRLENDERNFQPTIPGYALLDVSLAGEYGSFVWSVAVNNLLDKDYFNFGVASQSIFGTYNAYPLPGRTFLVTVGAKL